MIYSQHIRLLLLTLLLIMFNSISYAEEQKVMPCMDDAKYHEFDFWLGHWDVFDKAGKKQGSNIIEKIYDGCLITERWTSVNNTPGFSAASLLSTENPSFPLVSTCRRSNCSLVTSVMPI